MFIKVLFFLIVILSQELDAGNGMSCLSTSAHQKQQSAQKALTLAQQKKEQEEAITHVDRITFVFALENDHSEEVASLLKAKPALIFSRINAELVKSVEMATVLKESGFNFGGEQGFMLLYSALFSYLKDNRDLVAYYIDNGADPNYVVDNCYEARLDRTVMNESFLRDNDRPFGYGIDLFVKKVCLLIEKGASLCASTSRGEDAIKKPLVPYRQNVPWQLKRCFFTNFCLFKKGAGSMNDYRKSRAKELLVARAELMKSWDEKWNSSIKTLQSIECLGLQNIEPILQIIINYAIGQKYLELENATYHEQDYNGITKPLLNAPKGNGKPCFHGLNVLLSRGGNCIGPCNEVFEAFGMQKPSQEEYQAMRMSRFDSQTATVEEI